MSTYEGPRIDTDVHHTWKTDAEVVKYLPARWREYADGMVSNWPGRSRLEPSLLFSPLPNGFTNRIDSIPPSGGPPASEYEFMAEQLLDPFSMRRIVVSFEIGLQPAVTNVEFAAELTKAVNRWQVDYWMSIPDDRVYGSLLLNTQQPELAAEEIRAYAGHPKIAEALLVVNGAGKPFGHPVYHPVYEAAAEVGMPVGIHTVGDTTPFGSLTHTSAGGLPNTRFERRSLMAQPVHHYWSSFVVHGVFEKWPSLHLLLKETGVTGWVALLWELDACYDLLRRESSWVRRLPSEYFREHAMLSTQPLDEPADSDDLIEVLESQGGWENSLCFATDYPHHDTDDPNYIARRIPEAWWDKVFYENAVRAYGWTDIPSTVAEFEAAKTLVC
jgi:uncharacterized protein